MRWREPAASVLTFLAPKGYIIRTSQIVGSFIILNGLINALGSVNFFKKSNSSQTGVGGHRAADLSFMKMLPLPRTADAVSRVMDAHQELAKRKTAQK